MAAIASTPRSGREPCAATPELSTLSHRNPLWATHTSSAVGSVTMAASAHTVAASASLPMLAYSSSQTPVTITSPRSPAAASRAPASMIAARPPFMSNPPLPYRRPPSIRGENGSAMPSTPTTSMCAFRSSDRPPPRAGGAGDHVRAAGGDLGDGDLEPGPLEPAGRERRDGGLTGAARDQVGVDRVDRDELRDELGYRVHAGRSSIHGSPGSGAMSGWSRKASCATPSARRGAGRE